MGNGGCGSKWASSCIWRKLHLCSPLTEVPISFSSALCLLIHVKADVCLLLISFLSIALVYMTMASAIIHMCSLEGEDSALFNMRSASDGIWCTYMFNWCPFVSLFCFLLFFQINCCLFLCLTCWILIKKGINAHFKMGLYHKGHPCKNNQEKAWFEL